MRTAEKLAKIREQIEKLKQQVPPAAEKVRSAKLALPKFTDPIVKAKEALQGGAAADGAKEDIAALQSEMDEVKKQFPEVTAMVGSASALLSSEEAGLQDALKSAGSDLQQKVLKLNESLPRAGQTATEAKAKVDQIKARLEKSRNVLAKLEQSAGPTAESFRKQGASAALNAGIDALLAQAPGISDLVGQTLGKLSNIQNPIAQAAALFGASAGAGKDPKEIAARLARVQGHAETMNKRISGLSGLLSKGASSVPAVKDKVDQIQKILKSAAAPDAFGNLAKLVDEAIGESAASDEIAAEAGQFADLSRLGNEGSRLLDELDAEDLPSELKNKVSQIQKSFNQSLQQLPNVSRLLSDASARTGDISRQVKKARDVIGSVQKSAGGGTVDRFSKIQGQVQDLQQRVFDAAKKLSKAGGNLAGIEARFKQAADLLAKGDFAGFQDQMGSVSVSEAGRSEDFEGQLKIAQETISDLLRGDLPTDEKTAASQLEKLLGDAGRQIPDLSKQVSRAGVGISNISRNIEGIRRTALSFSPDFIKQHTQAADAKGSLEKAAAQFPKASQSISRLMQSLPQTAQTIERAHDIFSQIAQGKVKGGALEQLAKGSEVQQFLGEAAQLSNSPKLIADLSQKFSQLQGRIGQASQLMSGLLSGDFPAAEVGSALDDLKKVLAGATKSELNKHLEDAAGPTGGLIKLLPAIQSALGKIESRDIPQETQPLFSDLQKTISDSGKSLSEIGGVISEASASVSGVIAQVTGATQTTGALTAAFVDGLNQSAQTKSLLDRAAKEFPEVSHLVSAATASLTQLQDKVSQGQKLLAGAAQGTVKPENLLKGLADSPEFQGILKQTQDQFPEAAKLISQVNEALPELRKGLEAANSIVVDLQKGDITAGGKLAENPQVKVLLGEAEKAFPEAAAMLKQAQAVFPQAQESLDKANAALGEFQKGNYEASATQLANIPAVQSLLGEARKQFPEAAAVVSQAASALPQLKEGLQQANGAMNAVQEGDYNAALQQLQAMPAVQNLLGEAQKRFPEAAALASQAQERLAQVQDGLRQADALMTAFQNGDTNAALAQLKSLPAVQDLLASAQQQFPEAAAMLNQASTLLPQVQGHLQQANALMDAALAGNLAVEDLTQLPMVQDLLIQSEGEVTSFLRANTPSELQAALAAAEAIPNAQAQLAEAQAQLAAAQEGGPATAAQVIAAQAGIAAAESAVASESSSSSSESSSTSEESSSGAATVTESEEAEAAEDTEMGPGDQLLTISTPLGDDKFQVVNLSGEDQLSGLFFYRVELTSQDEAIDFTQLIGQSATVYLELGGDTYRNINGIVTRVTQLGTDADDNTTYVAEMRPWFWKLTKSADCRIYQAKTVIEIITGLFDELGFTDYKNSTTGTFVAREYTVQYRETAFNFLSRLMEDEGIFYYFEHEDGKHTLVLADDSDAYPDCTVAEVEFNPTDSPFEDEIYKCTLEQEITTGKYKMDDFHFETSETDLLVTAEGEGMSWYDYPGGFTTTDGGTAIANRRLAAIEAAGKVLRGKSTVKTFGSGYKFTLTQHLRTSMNVAYVLRRVSMRCDQQKYTDTFEAIPADTVFRPPAVTPRPVVHGAQTAIVVGKSGEEIWTDKYGRIKVQFHWDQVGVKDENSSCWVRVAQGWAGKGWGMLFLPRIGHEVIVSFLEGNPDRPLVTGSVYNAQNTVPYTLPDDQTKSTIKSMSSKTGTAGNEIRFQDLKDSEEYYFHAQKDMKGLVEHDWVNHVKNSQQTFVQTDDPTVDTEAKHVLIVNGASKITIKGDANEETHTNEGKFTHTVTKEYTLTVNGDSLTITAAGDLVVKGKTVTLESTSGDVKIKSAANFNAESAQAFTNKAGTALTNEAGTALTNKAGTALNNEAGTSMTNKASISLTNDGGAQLTNKASATQECDGGGMLTLKGGMVKIN